MGRGNWFPTCDLSDCEVAYLDYSNPDIESDDYDAWQWEWNYTKENIFACLPDSFSPIDDRYRHYMPDSVRSRDAVALASNSLFTLVIDGQGDSDHMGIAFVLNDNAPGFARSRMRKTAKAFFDKLAEIYPVRVRCCAWTIAPWPKSRDTANA